MWLTPTWLEQNHKWLRYRVLRICSCPPSLNILVTDPSYSNKKRDNHPGILTHAIMVKTCLRTIFLDISASRWHSAFWCIFSSSCNLLIHWLNSHFLIYNSFVRWRTCLVLTSGWLDLVSQEGALLMSTLSELSPRKGLLDPRPRLHTEQGTTRN
jgi:hypothetical protein